jgi:UDP:flavonoid glycosyltransferase YjiC (YdhE family)
VVLPDKLRFIGAASWEPASATPALSHPAGGRSAYYLQPGKTFDDPDPWPNVAEVLSDEDVTVYVSLGRTDTTFCERRNFVAHRFLPQNAVLPVVDGVIATGHTTSVLGAISHGKPLLLLPNGSGTYDIADLLERAGAALTVQGDEVARDADAFRIALRRFREKDALREAAVELRRQYARYDGAREGAMHVLRLLHSTVPQHELASLPC